MGAVRDPQDRTNWKWISGSDVSVSFWNHPGGNEDCARYDGSKGWLWSDTNCNAQINFICQHRKCFSVLTIINLLLSDVHRCAYEGK